MSLSMNKLLSNNASKVIYNHVKSNAKDYLIFSIVFVIGIMIGVFLVNNLSNDSKNDTIGYITSFTSTIKNDEFQINRIELAKEITMQNIKFVAIIWIAGTTIIGIPLIYLITMYKGICVGYTISAIVMTFGSWKGFLFSSSALLLQNVIIIPCILMLNVSSLSLYRTLVGGEKNASIKKELIRHTALCAILIVPIIIAAILSSFISSSLLLCFAKNV